MTSTLPDPLVPAEVDLRDFRFMPLDTLRLRDSDMTSLSSGDEFKAATLLWCASWHQVPASSIPDDERWQGKHSSFSGQAWRKVKEFALRNFILCSDGRRYHTVVAEKAADGWNAKLKEAHKRACDRQRKENKERKDRGEKELSMPPRPALLENHPSNGIPCWRYWNSDGTTVNSAGNPSESQPVSDGSRGLREGKGSEGILKDLDLPKSETGDRAPRAEGQEHECCEGQKARRAVDLARDAASRAKARA